ncbi:APC family permease [Nocardia pseudovaccinii]|uniref:APC family permease n=1 Tax=Nocardia pseudovaccinii TaxID=189540 RepID=UPI003D8DFBC8
MTVPQPARVDNVPWNNAPPDENPPEKLRGNMGVTRLVCSALAFNAPLAIMVGVVPLVIALGGGVGTPLIFIGLGLVMSLFAVGYTAMSRMIPRSGAFYVMVTAGLGRPAGLAASFLALFTYASGLAYALPFVSVNMSAFIARFDGPEISWWVWALVFSTLVAILGYVNVDFSARVQLILVACEVVLVVVYDTIVFATGGEAKHISFGSFAPSSLEATGVVVGVVFAISCFAGFESLAVYRDETRNPERTVPRATYITVGLITAFYAVGSWALIQAYDPDKAVDAIGVDPVGAYLTSIGDYVGVVARDIGTGLVITSTFAGLMAMHNIVARYLFNLGSDGALPITLGRPHKRFGSPHRASVTMTIATFIFIAIAASSGIEALKLYTTMAGLTGYSLVFLMFLAAVGIASYLLRKGPAELAVWQRTIAPILSAVAMTGIIVLVTIKIDLLTGSRGLSAAVLIFVACIIAFSVSIALWLRRFHPSNYQNIGTRI